MSSSSTAGGIDLDSITTRQEFAVALTAVRQRAGLTVREVARATGINASTAGGYFSGRHLPPLRTDGGLRSVLRACGIVEETQLEAWQRTLARIRRPTGPRPGGVPAPWPGLRAYGPDDAAGFIGRDQEVRLVLAAVCARRAQGGLTVLFGDPGTGKSSLLGAGLVPRLRAIPEDRPVAVLTPGRHPLANLAAALAELTGTDPGEVLGRLRRSPAAARALAEAARPGRDRRIQLPGDAEEADPGAEGVDPFPVLVVDQAEQLFVPGADDDEQLAFVAGLAAVCRAGPRGEPAPAAVVVALRSGFLSQAARYPDLREALRAPAGPAGPVRLRPLGPDQVRDVVVRAAAAQGVTVEDGLVDRIVADAAAAAEPVLPRLGHTLVRVWQHGQRARLTHAGYDEVGGLDSSVGTTADEACRALPPAARRQARDLLTRLHVVTLGGVVPAPPVPTDVAPDAAAALVAAGLLVADGDRVRAASGSLATLWPRLAGWLPEPPRAVPPAAVPPAADVPPAAVPSARTGRAGRTWGWTIAGAVLALVVIVAVAYPLLA
jgi:Helix-turn-helix domain